MDSPQVVPRPNAEPRVHTVFESSTQTWQWIVADPETKSALIIDPVLDQTPRERGICTTAADHLLDIVQQHDYRVVRILETHCQRSCQTAAWYLRTQLRDPDGNVPRICTGKSIVGVQRMFARQYRIHDAGWNRHFDSGFQDGQIFNVGHLTCQVIQLDPNSFAFVIGRNLFLGGDAPRAWTMGRLEGFKAGYRWHPSGGEATRPETAATSLSSPTVTPRDSLSDLAVQPFSPLAPNLNTKRYGQRPASAVHEMA